MSTEVLLVTANVGSIFEDPDHMLKIWMEEFVKLIQEQRPQFVALHCQEVGGKNYETSMKHVSKFVRDLLSSPAVVEEFDRSTIMLDEDFQYAAGFTALGNIYLVSRRLKSVRIWNWSDERYRLLEGHEKFSGDLADVVEVEKNKFPLDYFPDCKWSRKGYMRTRWEIAGTELDLVNIHLFHDACNMIALEASPSPYSENRRRALQHTLDRFHGDHHANVPAFIFGDFNFRVNTHGVVKHLTKDLTPLSRAEPGTLEFHDAAKAVVLRVGKKEFFHNSHQNTFLQDISWLRVFDLEPSEFTERLHEFPITFPPSYPFEENVHRSQCLMQTRCPSWCDRVFMTKSALRVIHQKSEEDTTYGMVGRERCMGDHKPVYLRFLLRGGVRTVCCGPGRRICTSTGRPLPPAEKSISLPMVGFPGSIPSSRRRCCSLTTGAPQPPPLRHKTSRLKLELYERLQSHHSSSDEEWFEEVDEPGAGLDSKRGSVASSQSEPRPGVDGKRGAVAISQSQPRPGLDGKRGSQSQPRPGVDGKRGSVASSQSEPRPVVDGKRGLMAISQCGPRPGLDGKRGSVASSQCDPRPGVDGKRESVVSSQSEPRPGMDGKRGSVVSSQSQPRPGLDPGRSQSDPRPAVTQAPGDPAVGGSNGDSKSGKDCVNSKRAMLPVTVVDAGGPEEVDTTNGGNTGRHKVQMKRERPPNKSQSSCCHCVLL